jgi:hypothetical protein
MKTTDFINEGYIADDADTMHKDHEVQMARQDCYNAAKSAIELHSLLKNISEMTGLEGWVSEKITLAADYLKTVKEHLEYEQLTRNAADVPAFSMESAEKKFEELINENVSAGVTGADSISIVSAPLGAAEVKSGKKPYKNAPMIKRPKVGKGVY